MKKKSKGSNQTAPHLKPIIGQTQQSITGPTTNIEARMVNKDQLENFLKDIWDESIRKQWWDHVERILISFVSICVPLFFQAVLDIFSKKQIAKTDFKEVRFWAPAAGIAIGSLIYIILHAAKVQRLINHDKKRFVAQGLDRFPMTSIAEVPYSNFRPFSPSNAEPKQKQKQKNRD